MLKPKIITPDLKKHSADMWDAWLYFNEKANPPRKGADRLFRAWLKVWKKAKGLG